MRVAGICQTVDVPTTILAACRADLPHENQGTSLLPWLKGERRDNPRDTALVLDDARGQPLSELRTMVTDRWKLQYYAGDGHIDLDDLQANPDETHPC